MGKEQETRQAKMARHANNWMHARFGGVDERVIDNIEPTRNTWYEDQLAEFDDVPRVMATEAEMRMQGFTMQPNVQYKV